MITALLILFVLLFLLLIVGIVIRKRRLWISSGVGLLILIFAYVFYTDMVTDRGISRKIPPSEVSSAE